MPVVNKPNIIIKFIIETSLIFFFDFNKLYKTIIVGIRRKTTYLIFWEVKKKLVSIVWSIPLSSIVILASKNIAHTLFQFQYLTNIKSKKLLLNQ